jgi:hypothetical protein
MVLNPVKPRYEEIATGEHAPGDPWTGDAQARADRGGHGRN